MLNHKAFAAVAAVVFAGILGAGQAGAQTWTAGGQGGTVKVDPNAFRGRMAFDPNSFRKMMSDRMKQMLGATDEEWTVLEPKIEKLQKLSNDLRGGGMGGMMFTMGGMTGGGEPSDVMKAARELARVLQKTDSSPGDIKSAVTALREAKAKAKVELEKAQKDLKEILTIRQEAQLIQMGLLE